MSSRPPLIGRSLVRDLVPFRGRRAAKLVPRTRGSGPMPWVIAIMIALTVMAAAAGLALGNLADRARADLSGGLTVQIVESNTQLRTSYVELAAQILTVLEEHQDPEVLRFALLTLSNLNQTEGLPDILQKFSLHENSLVQEAAHDAIEAYTQKNFEAYLGDEE